MNLDRLQSLPGAVKDIVFDDINTDINGQIAEAFKLPDDHLRRVLGVLTSVIVKEIKVLDFLQALEDLRLPNVDSNKLALAFARERLWPLQNWLGDVDILIRRLGGQMPAVQPAKLTIGEAGNRAPSVLPTSAKDYLKLAGKHKYLYLTRDYLRSREGQLVEPTVENWLKDYLSFSAQAVSVSLGRSQFLVQGENTKKLKTADRDNLQNFLISYDEGLVMSFETQDNYLSVTKLAPLSSDKEPADLPELLGRYKEEVNNLLALTERLQTGLLADSGQQLARLYDLLWEALGLAQTDRALVTLTMLAERQQLTDLLKNDQRFIGIMRRYLNIRFGNKVKAAWPPAVLTTPGWVLFFSLILVEKLGLVTERAAIISDYLSKLLKLKKQPVYLDQADATFRFREVVFSGQQFELSD